MEKYISFSISFELMKSAKKNKLQDYDLNLFQKQIQMFKYSQQAMYYCYELHSSEARNTQRACDSILFCCTHSSMEQMLIQCERIAIFSFVRCL